jgi:hypothetical protein
MKLTEIIMKAYHIDTRAHHSTIVILKEGVQTGRQPHKVWIILHMKTSLSAILVYLLNLYFTMWPYALRMY